MPKINVAIIGGGPAGVFAGYFASQNSNNDVVIFEERSVLKTLLQTGGGRCNLAHAEFDFRELAKFYPRGEKFLFSVFSKFSTSDTIDFFEKIGVKTYVQEDMRIFPASNSAKDVREKLLNTIKKCKILREKVINVEKTEENFKIKTQKNTYIFDKVIIAVGGHAGFELAKTLGHKIISPKPALTGFLTENNYSKIKGISVYACAKTIFENKKVFEESGNLLFTHKGVSGPLIYKISSVCARMNYSNKNPLKIYLDFLPDNINLQKLLEENSKKDIKNLLCDFVPKSFAQFFLEGLKLNSQQKCAQINKIMREKILQGLKNFEIKAVSPFKDGEVVTCGGVCLDEINSNDMQSKLVKGLYFCGEVVDIDGFCGGFNLQNCWSTGYLAGKS